MYKIRFSILILFVCHFYFSAFGQIKKNSQHILLGIPDKSSVIVSPENNYLIVKDQYVVSYNRSKNIPNWVGWHTDINDIGKAKRTNAFRPDLKLPQGWHRVKPHDYTGSGFDKGHLCPSADRTNNEKNNASTFLMTNMIPQAPSNNRGIWREFEEYCRRVVKKGNELYIIAGGYGEGGTGSKGKAKKIGFKEDISVPKQTWKVIIILSYGEDDLTRVNKETRIIAIDIPNKESVKNKKWRDYKITLAELEERTGYSFFNNISPDAKRVLLTKMDKR